MEPLVALEEAAVQTRMATQELHQVRAGLVMGQIVLAQTGLLTQPVAADLEAAAAVACCREVVADLEEEEAAAKTMAELAALEAEVVAPRADLPVREVLLSER
jgi:hypothetical protein